MPQVLKRQKRRTTPEQFVQPAKLRGKLNFRCFLNRAVRKRELYRFFFFLGLDHLCSDSSDNSFRSRNKKTCHNYVPPKFRKCFYAKKEGVPLLFRGTVYLLVYT